VLREDLAMAMTGWQQQMHSADHSEGEEHILDALLNPRLRDEWNPGHEGNESKVFENCDGEVGLLSGALTSEYLKGLPKEAVTKLLQWI
jgi:hypothetical protein